jgi:phage terminase small subunit
MTKKKPKESSRTTLTPKMEKFCLNFVKLGNATEAAIKAGYKNTPAVHSVATENLQKPAIQARIAELRKRAEDATIMNVLERKQLLSKIGRTNLTNFMEMGQDGSWVNIGPETPDAEAISEIHSRTVYDDNGAHSTVHTSVKLHDKLKAIDLLNKMDGIYKNEDTGNTINNYNVNVDKVLIDARGKLESIINRIASRAGEGEATKQPERQGSGSTPL